jgi:ABC-type Na+ efflux pump permease subunit
MSEFIVFILSAAFILIGWALLSDVFGGKVKSNGIVGVITFTVAIIFLFILFC